jgi:hypothetical protein
VHAPMLWELARAIAADYAARTLVTMHVMHGSTHPFRGAGDTRFGADDVLSEGIWSHRLTGMLGLYADSVAECDDRWIDFLASLGFQASPANS